MTFPVAFHAHHARLELKLDAACIETIHFATFCNTIIRFVNIFCNRHFQLRSMRTMLAWNETGNSSYGNSCAYDTPRQITELFSVIYVDFKIY